MRNIRNRKTDRHGVEWRQQKGRATETKDHRAGCVLHVRAKIWTHLKVQRGQTSKSKTRSSHYECFASRTTRAKPVFISNRLVAACAALLPIKRQDRPVSLGLAWPSKSTFITASGEGPIWWSWGATAWDTSQSYYPGPTASFNPAAHCLPAALWWRPTGVSSCTHLPPYYRLLYTESNVYEELTGCYAMKSQDVPHLGLGRYERI